jgi:hypothetical protein
VEFSPISVANICNAETSAAVIRQSDVTLKKLQQILGAAHYECTLERGSLCVKGLEFPRPIWLSVNVDWHDITLEVMDGPPRYNLPVTACHLFRVRSRSMS